MWIDGWGCFLVAACREGFRPPGSRLTRRSGVVSMQQAGSWKSTVWGLHDTGNFFVPFFFFLFLSFVSLMLWGMTIDFNHHRTGYSGGGGKKRGWVGFKKKKFFIGSAMPSNMACPATGSLDVCRGFFFFFSSLFFSFPSSFTRGFWEYNGKGASSFFFFFPTYVPIELKVYFLYIHYIWWWGGGGGGFCCF